MPARSLSRLVPAALLMLVACRDVPTTAPADPPALLAEKSKEDKKLAPLVRALAAARGVTRMPNAPYVRPALLRLGQALAFDKLLSGNRDISCMTCHLPNMGTGDGRSLSIGQGATGLGADRVHPTGAFIPRNAPPAFNLNVLETLFWDGRVTKDWRGRFHTPAGEQLTREMEKVLEYGPVSAIGLFPVQSREEMRSQSGNELAAVPDEQGPEIWKLLMRRLGKVPEYRRMFEEAYPGTRYEKMSFAHAANAIGGFLVSEFSSTNTPWDRFLNGNDKALSQEQLVGAQTFMTIRCSLCHNGPAFTDNKFHNVAVAQFGPGKGNGASGFDDFGRMNVTGLAADRYAFRTTPLRNVELTGPYGHDGAIAGLRQFIEHYSESELKLRGFDVGSLEPLLRSTLVLNFDDIMATRDTILSGVVLPDAVVDQLMAFMSALTDPRARELGRAVPRRVPSGLPVDGR